MLLFTTPPHPSSHSPHPLSPRSLAQVNEAAREARQAAILQALTSKAGSQKFKIRDIHDVRRASHPRRSFHRYGYRYVSLLGVGTFRNVELYVLSCV